VHPDLIIHWCSRQPTITNLTKLGLFDKLYACECFLPLNCGALNSGTPHNSRAFHSHVTRTHPASAPVWPDRPKVYGSSGICVVVAATPRIAPARALTAAAPRGQRLPTSSGPAELPRTSWCNVSIAQQQLLLLHVLHDHSYDGLHVIQPFVFI
jgi:hypothetical protein